MLLKYNYYVKLKLKIAVCMIYFSISYLYIVKNSKG